MSIALSKTDFLEYLQCSKCLWLKKNRPELYVPPDLTDFDKKNFDEGQEVEIFARELFPGGILLEGKAEDLSVKTRELIDQKKSPIFQATFIADGELIAKIDILEYDREKACWNIYEVKSSTKINTDRDHNHLKDVAFQKIVAERTGLAVGETYIIHLNKNYKKNGELDFKQLFVKVNVSEDVNKIYEKTTVEIDEAVVFLSNHNIRLDSCECLYLARGNHCSSFSVLNPSVPEYAVHDISRIHSAKLKSLVDSGILDITKVPDSFELTDIQRNQVSFAQIEQVKIDTNKVQEIIISLNTPLYFIDYETYQSAIPLLNGFGPHQKIPFQVSIHVFDSSGNLKHFEYLAQNIDEAIPGVIGLMREVIDDKGSIISWHASFENTRNKEIGGIFSEYRTFLESINQRIFDLETLFKKDYIHPGFKGKTSIKKVLPVLLPEFSYENLGIQGGTEAMENWRKIVFDDISNEERNKIREDLLAYCKMDTLAMVEIYKHLVKKIEKLLEY